MTETAIQPSFSSGELRPELYARVDLARYKTGVARAKNFIVDMGGGLFSRPGLVYTEQQGRQGQQARLVEFKSSADPTQAYLLEIGHFYIRVLFGGELLVRANRAVTDIDSDGVTPVTVLTDNTAGDLVVGTDVYLTGSGLPLSVRRRVLTIATVTVVAGTTVRLTFTDPDGDSLIIPAVSSGTGNLSLIVNVVTPYPSANLSSLSFNQAGDVMTITSKLHPIKELRRVSADTWTLVDVTIGSSIAAPTGLVLTPSSVATTNYSYRVTAVALDTGDESQSSARQQITNAPHMSAVAGSVTVDWDAQAAADYFNVYRTTAGVATSIPANMQHGFIGYARDNKFVDTNYAPDFTRAPPSARNPFSGSTNRPAVSCYYDQRLVYAGTLLRPQTLWGSKPGQFTNFDVTTPANPSDAFNFTLGSTQVNYIRALVTTPGGLGIFTTGGFWVFQFTGTAAKAVQHTYQGISEVRPLPIKFDILYVQTRGNIVSALTYSGADGSGNTRITGQDLSTLSSHLFEGRRVKAWAYAEYPYSVVWCVMDDGSLLAFTYMKEQEVYGWTRCVTKGLFVDVAVVTESARDTVYFIVEREIDGSTRRLIERFADRVPALTENAFCVDCGLTTELTYPTGTLRPNAATGSSVTFFSSAGVFGGADVGKVIRVGGGTATVVSITSAQQAVCNIGMPIRDTVPGTNDPVIAKQGEWSMTAPFTSITGLEHLEGQTVAVLADGVDRSPKTVTNGSINLAQGATLAHVGLSYECDMQTLPLDFGEIVVQGRRRRVTAVSLRVYETRGLQIGPRFVELRDFKESAYVTRDQDLISQEIRVPIDVKVDTEGQVCIRQSKPLPAMILSIVPEIFLGN